MRRFSISFGFVLVLEVACRGELADLPENADSSTGTSTGTVEPFVGTDTGTSSGSGTTGEPAVPEPCMESELVDVYEPDFEPNDAPHRATDLCTVDTTGTWNVSAELGGNDSIDYFVFRTAGDTGIISFRVDFCWQPAMDLTLFDVTSGEHVKIWTSSSASSGCEEAPGILPAGRVFLLEVRAPHDAPIVSPSSYAW